MADKHEESGRYNGRVHVTFEVDFKCGPWDGSISMSELRKRTTNEARQHAGRIHDILTTEGIKSRGYTIGMPFVDLGEKP